MFVDRLRARHRERRARRLDEAPLRALARDLRYDVETAKLGALMRGVGTVRVPEPTRPYHEV